MSWRPRRRIGPSAAVLRNSFEVMRRYFDSRETALIDLGDLGRLRIAL